MGRRARRAGRQRGDPGDTFCAARTADALLVEDVREAITTKEMSEVIVELGGSRLVEGNPARYDALERELFTNG